MAPSSSPFLNFLYSVRPGFFCGWNSCAARIFAPQSQNSQTWEKSALVDARKLGKQSGLPKKELRLLSKPLTNLSLLESPPYMESRKLD